MIRNCCMLRNCCYSSIFKFSSKIKLFGPAINHFYVSNIKQTTKNIKPDLKQYQAIKNRQNHVYPKQKQITQSIQTQRNHFNHQNINTQYKCDGCNTYLQFKDNKRYGFINSKFFKQGIQQNTNIINETYGQRVLSGDAKVIDFLHQIQKQANIEIFSQNKAELKNLDNLAVLLLLQQKIDKFEQQNQTLKRSKKMRKQLYCYRCYSLKYHNHLPEQYDDQVYEGGLIIDRQIVLQKVFKKHKSHENITHYLLVLDALDIFGTLKKDLLFKLLQKNISFSVVINKCDILNQKYLSQSLVHQQVKKNIRDYLFQYQKALSQHNNFSAGQKMKQIKIFFVSSLSRQGIKKIEQFMNEGIKRIQLFGLPNTGKTSLLNKLLKSDKITSKIPGTTIRVSEFTYRNKIKIFDMPGLHYTDLMYNLISKPSLKSILTWSKFYSPPLMTHHCFIYGGKIQAEGLRIIPFGMGGFCSSDNRWFILNFKDFWKGLPALKQLQIVKHQHTLIFKDGRTQDLQICGYGFISFKPTIKSRQNFETKIKFYLPQKVGYHFRESVLKTDNIFHNKSAFTKRHHLQRIQKQANSLIN